VKLDRLCIIILTFFWGSLFFAQTNEELKQLNVLDSVAFSGLESNISDAEKKANELLDVAIKYDSPVHQINAYTILGIVNKNKGYYVTSVDFYQKALIVAEESNDKGRVSACYNNIGSVYQIQENYDKALYYFKESLAIEDKLNNPIQKSIRLYNLGEIYRELDSMTLALSHFNSSLLIEKEYNNEDGIVYALLGIADIYLQLGKLTDARISIDESEIYLDNSGVEIRVLFGILRGRLLKSEGRYGEALTILQDVKDLSKQYEFKVHLMDIYKEELEIKELQEENQNSEESSRGAVEFIGLILFAIVILTIVLLFFSRRRSEKNKSVAIENMDSSTSSKETLVFKLENEKGKTLIELEADKIICFESNDNYVIIYYLSEDNKLLKSMERSSLKKIEKILFDMNLYYHRVHKSYIINPLYVEKVFGKAQAHKLKVSYLEFEVPISRSFDITSLRS
jgi:tetratricopeptide (TPR) repeat protein